MELITKYDVIKELESSVTATEWWKIYDIGKATITNIKNRNTISKIISNHADSLDIGNSKETLNIRT